MQVIQGLQCSDHGEVRMDAIYDVLTACGLDVSAGSLKSKEAMIKTNQEGYVLLFPIRSNKNKNHYVVSYNSNKQSYIVDYPNNLIKLDHLKASALEFPLKAILIKVNAPKICSLKETIGITKENSGESTQIIVSNNSKNVQFIRLIPKCDCLGMQEQFLIINENENQKLTTKNKLNDPFTIKIKHISNQESEYKLN